MFQIKLFFVIFFQISPNLKYVSPIIKIVIKVILLISFNYSLIHRNIQKNPIFSRKVNILSYPGVNRLVEIVKTKSSEFGNLWIIGFGHFCSAVQSDQYTYCDVMKKKLSFRIMIKNWHSLFGPPDVHLGKWLLNYLQFEVNCR